MIFLKDGIKEEYRIKKDVVNLRQTKKDVLKKAVEMFTTSVSLRGCPNESCWNVYNFRFTQ